MHTGHKMGQMSKHLFSASAQSLVIWLLKIFWEFYFLDVYVPNRSNSLRSWSQIKEIRQQQRQISQVVNYLTFSLNLFGLDLQLYLRFFLSFLFFLYPTIKGQIIAGLPARTTTTFLVLYYTHALCGPFVVLKLIVYSPELLELPESPFLCRISFIFQTRALINTAVFLQRRNCFVYAGRM